MSQGDFSRIIIEQFQLSRQYANAALALATPYISALNSYVVGEINTAPPVFNIDVPSSIVVDPTLVGEIPIAPTDYPALPDAPLTSEYSFPAAPVYTLPTIPTLSDIVLPSFVEGIISPLTSKMPIADIDVPALGQIESGGQSPEDEFVQTTKAKLVSNISNGGTMLNPMVEADIWNRERERREQSLQDAVDKLTAQWAKLGWSIPDGLLAGSMIALNNEYMNKDLDVSRDIAIKQAELEQTGMFKSLELSNQLEGVLIGSFNEYAKRVFEASKTTADVTLQIFKSRIDLYNANLAAFKTDVETYKISIEAELAKAEVYKTRMLGAQVAASVDETKVKVYIAQLSGIAQQVEVFKTTVQSVSLMYEAEKQKVEAYKSRVEAYTSAIEGVTKRYLGEVEGFKAFIQAYTASAETQTKLSELDLRAQVAEADATLKSWEVQLNIIVENTRLKLEALRAVAQTASNLTAGAMAGGHAAVSLSGAAAFDGFYA